MHILHSHFEDKKHIIWDWNGTLLSDLHLVLEATNVILREAGKSEITAEEYKRVFRFPVIEYYRDVGLPTEPVRFSELCDRFNDLFQRGLHTCDLHPGARETLAHVKSLGKMQSVLSASEQSLLWNQVRHCGVEAWFDHVVGIADKLAASKVSRGHELIKKSGVAPADTVMIGDTDHDHEVAQALGIDLILVEHGHQDVERLRRVHHKVVKVF